MQGIRCVCAVGALVLGGCYAGLGDAELSGSGQADAGSAGDGDGDGGPAPQACNGEAPSVSWRPLRRLNPLQYQNTVRALFGDAGFEADYDEEEAVLTLRGVRQLRGDAEAILARKSSWTEPVFPCDTSGAADESCATQFIDAFGARAFRRPLTDTDRAWLTTVYHDAITHMPFADAMDVVVAAVLQAPAFVYLSEAGVAVDGAPDHIRRLTDHEVATRLSYLLWDTMPDSPLLDAAAEGELQTDEGLRAQVERMFDDPRAEAKIQNFTWHWLQLDGGRLHFPLEETVKDAALFPEYTPALQDAMRTELEAFVHRVYFEDAPASFDALMTDNRAYVNGALAQLYGAPNGPADDDTWAWVDLDPEQRGGLATRSAFLTVFAAANVQSPIRRGVFVLEELLCSDLGEPPPNASDTPVDGGDDDGTGVKSVREDVEARTQGPDCGVCHNLINPTGFAFEHYDAIGRWQDDELTSGLPIDSSGQIQTSDVDGPVADALELSQRLAGSEQVRTCFARRWMTDAMGQPPGKADECAEKRVIDEFTATGDLRELLVQIVLSESFRYLSTQREED